MVRDRSRTGALLVACALVLALPGCSRTSETSGAMARDSTYTLLQMNLCLSGLAGCYDRAAYPAGVEDAVARIREARPDAVTFNEICRRDGGLIARRTGYHLRFARVIYRGEPLHCVQPGGRGLFGVAVLTEAAIESTDSQEFSAQAGLERRRWLCVTTRVGVEVCTAHLNTRTTIEVAGNDAQSPSSRRSSHVVRPPTPSCSGVTSTGSARAPPTASGPAPTGPRNRPPGSSTSTEAARFARPRRRWCPPRTPTTTSCSSARASPNLADDPIRLAGRSLESRRSRQRKVWTLRTTSSHLRSESGSPRTRPSAGASVGQGGLGQHVRRPEPDEQLALGGVARPELLGSLVPM